MPDSDQFSTFYPNDELKKFFNLEYKNNRNMYDLHESNFS